MNFKNNTSFPAIGWLNYGLGGKEYNTVTARVKFRFKEVDETGKWQLKLDPDQGELFGEDVFYEDNIDPEKTSVLYESDYCSYKPDTDIIFNTNTYAPDGKLTKQWHCGFTLTRTEKDRQTNKPVSQILLKKELTVTGKHTWQLENFLWDREWVLGDPSETTQVPLRYEYAYGGGALNPDFNPEEDVSEGNLKYLAFHDNNPTGKGVIHASQLRQEEPEKHFEAPQILYPEESQALEKGVRKNRCPSPKQVAGFGIVHRAWLPRRSKIGTVDKAWQESKAPLLPDDFDESFNNGAPEDQQVEGYIKFGDEIKWQHLSTGKAEQSFEIPLIFFRGSYRTKAQHIPFHLDIDTVVVDLREESSEDWFLYISWRKRVPYIEAEEVSLDMLLGEEFVALDEQDKQDKQEQEEERG